MMVLCSLSREMNMSTLSEAPIFLVLEAIRRKMTAAKERNWRGQHRSSAWRIGPEVSTYRRVGGRRDLLGEAHQQPLGPLAGPLVLEDILGLRADAVVGRLELPEQLHQLGADLGRQEGHAGQLLGRAEFENVECAGNYSRRERVSQRGELERAVAVSRCRWLGEALSGLGVGTRIWRGASSFGQHRMGSEAARAMTWEITSREPPWPSRSRVRDR